MNSNKLEPVRIHLPALEEDLVASLVLRAFKTNLDRVVANNNLLEIYSKNLRNFLVGHLKAVEEEQHKIRKKEETLS
jgi:regulator of replication initiation timing